MALVNNTSIRRCGTTAIVAAVVFTLLAVASSLPAGAAAQPTPSPAEASARADKMAARKNKNDIGIQGHGFVADNGVFTTIDFSGAVRTQPYGINNQGQVVGEYVDAASTSHGFLLDNGTYTTIDAPGGTSTWATDIDDHGRIVGISFGREAGTIAASVRGFLRDAQGAFTPLDAPAAPPPPGRPELPTTQPFGINNLGQITGVFTDSEGILSFLLDDGVFTTIEAPDAVGSTLAIDVNDDGRIVGAYDVEGHGVLRDRRGNFTTIDHPDGVEETVLTGINNRGQIVGAFSDRDEIVGRFNDLEKAAGSHGVLLDESVFTQIDVPSAVLTTVNRISQRGPIVGMFINAGDVAHGYIFDDGVFTTIDAPGATTTEAVGINDHGQIVGVVIDAGGVAHGFCAAVSKEFVRVEQKCNGAAQAK